MKLNIGKKRTRDDDELEVVEQEVTENAFRCPFSTLQFKKPMKNNACPHRVDKSSLDQMLKQKNEVKCPVGGCSKTWKRGNYTEDKELLVEMNRYFKNIAPTQQEYSQATAFDLDDDDEEEYTLVKWGLFRYTINYNVQNACGSISESVLFSRTNTNEGINEV